MNSELTPVENTNPSPTAAKKYNHIRVDFPDGESRSLLFTDKEIEKALDRANKNPEDTLDPYWGDVLVNKIKKIIFGLNPL